MTTEISRLDRASDFRMYISDGKPQVSARTRPRLLGLIYDDHLEVLFLLSRQLLHDDIKEVMTFVGGDHHGKRWSRTTFLLQSLLQKPSEVWGNALPRI